MVDFRDEEGRRHGDWLKKDLRKNANDLVEDSDQKKWYEQNFWIIILLFMFWPIGLFLCWKSSWPLAVKIIATIFLLCYVGVMIVFYSQQLMV